jgi:hypothetical protein
VQHQSRVRCTKGLRRSQRYLACFPKLGKPPGIAGPLTPPAIGAHWLGILPFPAKAPAALICSRRLRIALCLFRTRLIILRSFKGASGHQRSWCFSKPPGLMRASHQGQIRAIRFATTNERTQARRAPSVQHGPEAPSRRGLKCPCSARLS